MCGYRCDMCPAYAPNIGSEEDAKSVCEGFKECYGFTLKPEEVACVGCRNEGRHADADCPVRPCVMARGLDSCAQCAEFDSCNKLKTRVDFLDPLREKLSRLPPDVYKKFVVPYLAKPRMLALRKAFLRSKGQ